MTTKEWAEVLGASSSEELPNTLLAMADEEWLSESWAAWLRQVAHRLHPYRYDNTGQTKDLHWYWTNQGHGKDESPSWIPDIVVNYIGRVGHFDKPSSEGHWTPNRSSKQEAWLDLLRALETLS